MQQAFVELGRLRLDQPLRRVMEQVAGLALLALPGVDDLSITTLGSRRSRSRASTSPLAALLDAQQRSARAGPGVEAARGGRTVHLDLSTVASPYPASVSAAREHDLHAWAAVGMPVPRQLEGALNLYSRTGPLPPSSLRLAQAYASFAAVVVTNASSCGPEAGSRPARRLRQALVARCVLEQARGITSSLHGASARMG